MANTQSEHPQRLAWTVQAFCRALGIGRTTLYKLIAENKIKTIVVGGRRLIPDSEARRLLAEAA